MVVETKKKYPQAKLAAHPECTEEVLKYADYIGSTSGIIDYVVDTDCEEFIIATVDGVFGEIRKKAPGRKLYTLKPDQVCVNMKMVTLDTVSYTHLDVYKRQVLWCSSSSCSYIC